MTTKELRDKMYETESFGEEFEEFVRGGYPNKATVNGVELELTKHERDNAAMICVFKADGKFYETQGSYDSWNGTEWYDIRDFYEVEAKQVTVTQYVPVKG